MAVKSKAQLKEELEELQAQYDALEEAYIEMENRACKIANNDASVICINDIANFKFRMQLDGIYTEELGEWIDYYLRWHNQQ